MLSTKSRIIAAVATLLSLSALAFAGVPQTINYQGYLKDGAGKPVSVSMPMVFSLYSSGNGQTPLWTEPQTVAVNNGIYSVTLGSTATLDPSQFSSQLYLGIRVGSDTIELQPRQPLSSVPYALQSGCIPGDKVECYTGPAITRGKGICTSGSRLCGVSGLWGSCVGQILPRAEILNGIDDDCDGVIDNPAPQTDCLPGEIGTCYFGPVGTLGVGICISGSHVCADNGFWDPCIGEVLPQPEIMNNLDDNCDGLVDNFFCSIAADCGADNACMARTCVNNTCGAIFVPNGTPLQIQTPGDCKTAVCNGAGAITSLKSDADMPDDGNQCTSDSCNNGNPVHQPTSAGWPCAGGVCNGFGTCVQQCTTAADCGAGTQCANPVCNDNICGLVNKVDGLPCNDGSVCTSNDVCSSGVCAGSPLACPGSGNSCTVAICNPATGCGFVNAVNGAACDDGNACTQIDSCQAGTCTGSNPVTCEPLDQCHLAGVCNPVTGQCVNQAKANGTACSDGNACTQTDSCQGGTCTGSNPVTCTALDQCHLAGTCDSATGSCMNPTKSDGTPCDDGNAGTINDACIAGVCQ